MKEFAFTLPAAFVQSILIACLFFSSPALSETSIPVKKQKQKQAPAPSPNAALKAVLANPDELTAAITSGETLSQACVKCHGPEGVSKEPDQVNLNGQNPAYFLTQIEKHTTGKRQIPHPQSLFANLGGRDRINLAVYYGSLQQTSVVSKFLSPGKELYELQCASCHGEQARGSETTPSLAGQHADYLTQAVGRYKDKAGPHVDPLMAASVVNLQDLQIRAIALYLSSIR